MHFAKLDDSPMFRKQDLTGEKLSWLLQKCNIRMFAEVFWTVGAFFMKQIQCLEESAESLRERSLKFYKGCRKYTEGLGEGYDGDIAFASALETFGGGHNDPISVAFGGPVMTKFTIALREIGTYKEVLRSQVKIIFSFCFGESFQFYCCPFNELPIHLNGCKKFQVSVLGMLNEQKIAFEVEHMLNDRLIQFVNIDLHDVKEARKRFDKASLLYDQGSRGLSQGDTLYPLTSSSWLWRSFLASLSRQRRRALLKAS
ncbi:ADP-ribosylation factor GTPase-activating protein AGD3 [Vitis vinifera]|uniref:ADP-ribosylation factor GTPase-activating protein AGD3 n=1 Tax=Vitis vinifera TaxID=29760 RepID=A0A438H0X1_VITVI|nr:ADP-ribosylation factor GTPase-activating protein AGD3 [Vitis vinifera]